MEIIAKLDKPYTDEQRCNFIVEYNHQQGYEIRETEAELQAWAFSSEEKEQQKEAEFKRKFFNTSLGYVSRDVHMKNGTVKDFLTDILPLLKVGIPVLVYTRQLEQSKVSATQQFIDECGQQLIADFYGEN